MNLINGFMKKKNLNYIIAAAIWGTCTNFAFAEKNETNVIGERDVVDVTGNDTVTGITVMGGTQNLYDNAHAINTEIAASSSGQIYGYQKLYGSSTAEGSIVNSRSYEELYENSSTTNTSVNSGGKQNVYDNASTLNTVLSSDSQSEAQQNLYDNASSHDTLVALGGRQSVYNNATTSETVLIEGGMQWLYNDAVATGTQIEKRSSQYLSHNAQAIDTIINGGSQHISGHGAIVENTVIRDGGLQQLTGGHANNTTLYNSSQSLMFQDYAPGSVSNTTLYGSSTQMVFNGGSSAYDTILHDDSVQKVVYEGSVYNTKLYGNADQLISTQGSAYKTEINDSARQIIYKNSYAENTTVNNGYQLVLGGAVAHNTTVHAGKSLLYTDAKSTGFMNINASGILEMEAGSRAENVTLNSGRLFVTDITNETTSFTPAFVETLRMENGVVSFLENREGDYAALRIGNLSGTGSFWFNTSIADRNSNFVTIENGSGQFDIVVTDSGRDINDNDSLTVNLIQDVSAGAEFTLIDSRGSYSAMVDGGTYMYTLYKQENKDGLTGNVWYLGLYDETTDPGVEPPPSPNPDVEEPEIVKPKTSPSTDAILGLTSATLRVVNAELDGLRAYRATLNPMSSQQNNVWGHYLGNKSRVNTSNSAAFNLEQQGMELGADTRKAFERGVLVGGVFMSYSDNKVKHERGGKSTIDSYGLGIYATWFDNSGLYVDGVLKGNRLNSKLNAKMTKGDSTSGEWHHYGVNSALETGYRFTLTESVQIAPYLRTTAAYINSANVKLTNGMVAETGKPRSLTVEAGTQVSSFLTLGETDIHPYLRAAVVQETAKSNQTIINQNNRFDNNVNGTSGRYGVGASVSLDSNATLYAEINYRQGRHIEEPIQGIMGLKVSF